MMVVALTATCVGTPLPDPPNGDIEVRAIQLGDIEEAVVAQPFGPRVQGIAGKPGSSEPGVVVAVNLSRSDVPVRTSPVESDGSFIIDVFAEVHELVRIYTRRGPSLSTPLDLVAGSLSPPLQTPVCPRISPGRATTFAARVGQRVVNTVLVVDACAPTTAVPILATSFRAPSVNGTFRVLGMGTSTTGASLLTVEFLGEQVGFVDDVLSVQVSDSQTVKFSLIAQVY